MTEVSRVSADGVKPAVAERCTSYEATRTLSREASQLSEVSPALVLTVSAPGGVGAARSGAFALAAL